MVIFSAYKKSQGSSNVCIVCNLRTHSTHLIYINMCECNILNTHIYATDATYIEKSILHCAFKRETLDVCNYWNNYKYFTCTLPFRTHSCTSINVYASCSMRSSTYIVFEKKKIIKITKEYLNYANERACTFKIREQCQITKTI